MRDLPKRSPAVPISLAHIVKVLIWRRWVLPPLNSSSKPTGMTSLTLNPAVPLPGKHRKSLCFEVLNRACYMHSCPSVMRVVRTPHRTMERTRTGRMKQHRTITLDHIRPRPVRVDVLRSGIYKVAVIIQLPAFYGPECAYFEELRINNVRLRAGLVGMATTPCTSTPLRAERRRLGFCFEPPVTTLTLRLGFDSVDRSEPAQLLIMRPAQAFSGPHLEASVSRAQVAVRYEIVHHVAPF